MKLHWSIADQELHFDIEHTGKRVRTHKIYVPFLSANYFMWSHEDKETITRRLLWIGSQLKTRIFG